MTGLAGTALPCATTPYCRLLVDGVLEHLQAAFITAVPYQCQLSVQGITKAVVVCMVLLHAQQQCPQHVATRGRGVWWAAGSAAYILPCSFFERLAFALLLIRSLQAFCPCTEYNADAEKCTCLGRSVSVVLYALQQQQSSAGHKLDLHSSVDQVQLHRIISKDPRSIIFVSEVKQEDERVPEALVVRTE